MRDFDDRTKKAAKLEIPFINTLNEICQTHRIANFGVENTDVKQLHQYIRESYDISSRFVRFLPDSVIVRTDDKKIGLKTALIEFKVQNTLIYDTNFFKGVKTEYQKRIRPGDPPLINKPQIFEVEKDALDIYKVIATKLEVEVVVIGWQKTETTDRLIAQYANKIVVCHDWIPSKKKRDSGSGTAISNTHIDSYEPLDVFCSREFGIDDQVLNEIMQSIRKHQ